MCVRRRYVGGLRRSLGRGPAVRSNRASIVDFDLAVVLSDLDVGERRERLAELLVEHVTLERERGPVAGTVETSVDLLETEEAALVCAHSGDRRKLAVVVHDEPDVGHGGEPR